VWSTPQTLVVGVSSTPATPAKVQSLLGNPVGLGLLNMSSPSAAQVLEQADGVVNSSYSPTPVTEALAEADAVAAMADNQSFCNSNVLSDVAMYQPCSIIQGSIHSGEIPQNVSQVESWSVYWVHNSPNQLEYDFTLTYKSTSGQTVTFSN